MIAALLFAAALASFTSNGVTISYTDSGGSGEPVVLIHGFTGSAERHFGATGVMSVLERAGYRVVALDCRGHGQSGKPLDPSKYGVEMANDVVRLLDHLKINRAHVVGYSMGGMIAAQLLVKQPRRLLTVTLLGSGWEGESAAAFTAQMSAMADGFDRRNADALIRGVFTSSTGGPSDAEVAAATADLFSRNDPAVLAAVARGLPPLAKISRDKLMSVRTPVLGIDGEFDRSNLENAKQMSGLVPSMHVIILPGTNHATAVRPSAEHIVEFLSEHQAR